MPQTSPTTSGHSQFAFPWFCARRGGPKLVITPAWTPPWVRVDKAIVKALARAHRPLPRVSLSGRNTCPSVNQSKTRERKRSGIGATANQARQDKRCKGTVDCGDCPSHGVPSPRECFGMLLKATHGLRGRQAHFGAHSTPGLAHVRGKGAGAGRFATKTLLSATRESPVPLAPEGFTFLAQKRASSPKNGTPSHRNLGLQSLAGRLGRSSTRG